MLLEALEHLKMGLGLFICVAGLALFLTTPVAIMFMAAHFAQNAADQYGQIAGVVGFSLLSLFGVLLTLLVASFVQEALE